MTDCFTKALAETMNEGVVSFGDYMNEWENYNHPLLEFFDGKDKLSPEEETAFAKKSKLQFMKIGKWNVKPTRHGAARAAQRVPDITSEQWKTMNEIMVKRVEELRCGPQHSGKALLTCLNKKTEKEIVFYSNAMKQGYVVAYDPQKSELRIITVFPAGRSEAIKNSIKIVENYEIDVLYVEDAMEDGSIIESYLLNGVEYLYEAVSIEAQRNGYLVDYKKYLEIIDAQDDIIEDYKVFKIPFLDKKTPLNSEGPINWLDVEVYQAPK